MSIILGLDLSLTNAGIAILTDGRPTTLTSVGHGGKDGASHQNRSRRIVSQTRAIMQAIGPSLLNPARIDLAVIEDQLEHGPMLPSALDRSALWWGVYSALDSKRIPVAIVNPGTLKKWATGKGNAKKPEVLAAAREWCRPRNHDEADAAWLALMGAVKLGDYPVVALTDWRINGLDAVKWPEVVGA